MKNLTALFILAGGILCTTFAYAGDTTALKAEKICSPQIDIFNIDNLETLLGIVNGEKLLTSSLLKSECIFGAETLDNPTFLFLNWVSQP